MSTQQGCLARGAGALGATLGWVSLSSTPRNLKEGNETPERGALTSRRRPERSLAETPRRRRSSPLEG